VTVPAAPGRPAPDPPARDSPAPDRPAPEWRLVAGKELGDLLGRIRRRPVTRTLVIVGVFGLLIPPALPVPGGGGVSAALVDALAVRPAVLAGAGAVAAAAGLGWLWWLARATLRRTGREALALVGTDPDGVPRPRRRRRRADGPRVP